MIKITPLPKLHLAASTDKFRENLNYIQFKTLPAGNQGNAGMYMAATDAHILAWTPVDFYVETTDLPAEFYIHNIQFKKLCQSKVEYITFNKDSNVVCLHDKSGNVFDTLLYLDAEKYNDSVGKFPDYTCIIPTKTPELDKARICFSSKKVYVATQIFGEHNIRFVFHTENRPCLIEYVRPEEHGELKAVICPLIDINQ